ncbi:DUF4957 domain-containing protein [Belliella sp. DSM 111904]|uniref:DUF4957 domain-containing protein n=1 Tax=Belliella filtrata TaxID=2923435 RepID=A0ABS9UXF0_9BACT|nr:DUF4957 domain-containing protein [Belliella filtrata]MCH7408400.1 DUF4957 domain-containing protein [Belliella filtrata]
MKSINKNILNLCLVILLGIGLGACTDIEPNYEAPDDMKRFRPVRITGTNGEIAVTLTWPEALFTNSGEVNYLVQISQDSLFSAITLEKETVVNTLEITDEELEINVDFFARVRTLGVTSSTDSEWQRTMLPFRITGEQIFLPTFDNEIGASTVLLRWRPTANPSRIELTDQDGIVSEVILSDENRSDAEVLLEELNPLTEYFAEIFEGNRTKGTTSFVTKEPSIYDIVLTPSDNFRAIVEGAEDGAMIGLQPGTYEVKDEAGEWANLRIIGKSITLQSVSGDPEDTKVLFREFTFTESGAGFKVSGITFDGGPGNGAYFINFAGGAATFTDIIVENCIVEHVTTSFMRANRAGNNEHKMNKISVASSILRNHSVENYHIFHLDKLEFSEIEIINSTFASIGSRGFIGWATNIPMPSTPKITIDQVTLNGFGSRNRNDNLLDANNNLVEFTMTNSIITNMPYEGQTVGGRLVRANPDSQISLRNLNMFNLTTGGADPESATLQSYVQTANILNVNMGWDSRTTNLTLPTGSPLRTAGTTGGPIGDPRWAF